VRVAFATNDERTAKRISDALGTATEQRAMRNYAGHRLAPWLAHVMVSRQETARALLTPGEVMQLPADEELVLAAGVPPVRAKKLRYYEDRNFAQRVAAPPVLADGGYADRPPSQSHDWTDAVRGADARLACRDEVLELVDEGGLQQQRQPGLPDQAERKHEEAERAFVDLEADGDPVADQRAMDHARGLGAIARGYGLNESGDRDLVPGF
jgi:type IV secretion system protein VirD4